MGNFFKNIIPINKEKEENQNKKKIENIVFLVIILIVVCLIINIILKDEETPSDDSYESKNTAPKILAANENNISQKILEKELENILSTMKNVGKVNVLINYYESSSIIPLYDENTTVSTTEEEDSAGGTRTTTQTEAQKDIVFAESSGNKNPVTQKTIMPTIQGAIITAEGAGNVTVKANIVNAVSAVTGLSIDKIQVFEVEK